MKLYNTRIGKWLSLIRIQSTPVTSVSLCAGYLTVASPSWDMLILALVGAVGHWGFYAHNDVQDYEVDLKQGKNDKPLIGGGIDRDRAEIVSLSLIAMSLAMAMILFNQGALLTYVSAAWIGYLYNKNSKVRTYSAMYLGVWGVAIIVTGALYARGFNINTALLALLLALHMIWMTVIGDLKDIESDEPNLVHKYDCHIAKFTYPETEYMGEPKLFKSARFQLKVAFPLLLLQIALVLGIILHNNGSILLIAAFVFFAWDYFSEGWTIGYNKPYTENDTVKDIVQNEITGVFLFIIAISSFTPLFIIAVLLGASVVWGLTWQKVQYGRFLYFP